MSVFRLRSVISTVLAAALIGCSEHQGPTGIVTGVRQQATVGSDVAFGALDYNLASFDLSTLQLTGTTNLNPGDPYNPSDPYQPQDPYRTLAASFTTATRFVAARLDTYQPSDPYCPALASNYNASIGVSTSDGGLFYALISGMATNHCNARVLVDLRSATIRSFQPVP